MFLSRIYHTRDIMKGESYKKTDFQNLYSFLLNVKKFKMYLVVLLLFTIVTSVLALFAPEILRHGVNAIEKLDWPMLINISIYSLVYIVIFLGFSALKKLYSINITNKMIEDIQFALLNKIVSLKKICFSKFTSGQIITDIINNVEKGVKEGIFGNILMFNGIIIVFSTLIYMIYIDWRLSIGIIIFNIFIRLAIIYIGNAIKETANKLLDTINTNNSFIIDIIKNMATIRTFNRVNYFRTHMYKKEKQTQNASVRWFAWDTTLYDLVWMGFKVSEYLIIYGFGGYLVFIQKSEISIVVAFASVSALLVDGINYFIWGYKDFKGSIPSIKSVNKMLSIPYIEDEVGTIDLEGNFLIRFQGVSFSYGNRTILDDISFIIRENDKVLIKGKNGSGKTTILNLISGLYRPTKGNIYYGNFNINIINIKDLSKKYNYIFQNSNILAGEVYENLSLNREYDINECNEILKKLGIENVVKSNPKHLSQGERQRLNIGRALYKNNNIYLILGDEPFSNLDRNNMNVVMQLLSNEFKDKTVILVCHEEIDFQFNKIIKVEDSKIMVSEL